MVSTVKVTPSFSITCAIIRPISPLPQPQGFTTHLVSIAKLPSRILKSQIINAKGVTIDKIAHQIVTFKSIIS